MRNLTLVLTLVALCLTVNRCATAQGDVGASAIQVASPVSGFVCFAIISNGAAVGGNCAKE